ncbi:tropomyosin isoform X2 [Gossypium australe]|uniref:Tropomyosin isoform X2 n=3 Tax=Gossypium TaxID=3633 RepID=A0A5B6WBG7_9ROSI|nr:tropomyosin isoform X2 [Gossypium australe]
MAAPLFPAIFTGFFFFVFFISLTSQDQRNNNDHNLLIRELDDAKLKLSRLESVLEETIQSIDAKTLLLKEREKLLEDMENKITYLQSVISTLKDDSLLADEKLKALQEEVRLLWDASRKNNFELHVLESEAQDTEDRVEAVNLKVEKVSIVHALISFLCRDSASEWGSFRLQFLVAAKMLNHEKKKNKEMAEVVTEQWIQIQHLEQALQLAQRRALQDQRQRYMRCSFLKFFNDLSERHLPKMLGALEYYSFGKGSTIKYYMSQALRQLRRFYSAIKKYHHQVCLALQCDFLGLMYLKTNQVTLGDLHMSKLHKKQRYIRIPSLGTFAFEINKYLVSYPFVDSCKVSSNKKCEEMNLLQLLSMMNWYSFWYVLVYLLPFSVPEILLEFLVEFILVVFQASALITFPILGAWMVLSSQFS